MPIPMIVEIGVNHVGDSAYAAEYLDRLIEHKVYAVTFQVHSPQTTTSDPAEAETLKRRQLEDEFYLHAVARLKGSGIKIGFAITDYQSVSRFAAMGADFFKTLGADITCLPLFEKLAETKLPVFISTAYASREEIETALALLPDKSLVTLIYTDGIAGALGSTHLRTMEYFQKTFALPVAYGKHSVGEDVLIASLAFNPQAIFIYVKGDRQVAHPDDGHAVNWNEIPYLISRIAVIEQALKRSATDDVMECSVPEKAKRQRRRLIASESIAVGEKFSRHNVAATRPAGELSAGMFEILLGRTASRAYQKGESIKPSELTTE
jgi:N-acetylneuraminate synthase